MPPVHVTQPLVITITKNFAISGVHRIGEFVAEELLKLKAEGRVSSVVLLTRGRSDGTLDKLASLGATIATVDWSAPATVTAALTSNHVDVVISCLPAPALHLHMALADAAKEAGVKLFLPSEWGTVSSAGKERGEGHEWFTSNQQKLHQKLRDIGLPYLLVFNGCWSDFIFNTMFGWDVPNGKVDIWGAGNGPISYTHRRDVGRFVAHVLTTLPPEQLYWKELPIEGDRKIWQGYEAKTGRKLQVTYHPLSEQEAVMRDNPNTSIPYILAWGYVSWDKGDGVLVKSDEELANKLWPEWNPTPAVDALVETYS
ncbi:NAD(P)-binding protein [Heliocybe sulcata]|uniref:NAD(P)-binding protein n=1 Tax=Heliocybe sulcata TaxID=5364 RepID=A0A5C3MS67_9AGAM|nr:NAD(P)-binding protein [Heliocybe sulcata]